MRPLDPRLLRLARPVRVHLAILAVAGTLVAGLVVVQAWAISAAVDRVAGDGGPIAGVVALLVAAVVGRSVLAWCTEVSAVRASAGAKAELRGRLVRRACEPARDDAASVPSASRAELVTLATDGLDGLDAYFARYLPQLVLAVTVPATVLVVLTVTDLTAAVTVGLTLPLIPIFMVLIGRATERSSRRRLRALTRLAHHFLDVVEGMPTLRAFGRGMAQADRVRETTDAYRVTTMATLRVAFLSGLVLELIATLSVALVAVGVGLRLVDGDLGLRTGLFVILLAPEAYLPLRQVGVHFHAAAAGVAAAEATLGALDGAPNGPSVDDVPAGDLRAWDGPTRTIELAGICVHHVGRSAAPRNTSVVLRAGEVVALSGRSGAGKSSLLSVLLGLRTPDAGNVVVREDGDARSLDTIERSQWWDSIAWVDQTPLVIAGTVADNLRLGDPGADVVAMRAVLDRVGLALALDRSVGERGLELSAGERRRLAVARALLRRGDLVVLDEPTAGLDEDAERRVIAAIRGEADRGAAVVMVAHRPSAVRAADRIVEVV